MSKRFRITSEHQVLEVPHPDDPTIVVSLRRLTRFEAHMFNDKVKKQLDPKVLLHPQTGQPLRNPITNQVETVYAPKVNFTTMEMVQLLKERVIGWSGVLNEHDQPVVFVSDKVHELFEPAFDYGGGWAPARDIDGNMVDDNGQITDDKDKARRLYVKAGFGAFIFGRLLEEATKDLEESESGKDSSRRSNEM